MLLLGAMTLLSSTVTFSAPASPAARLLPELGRAAGLKLEAGTTLAREVLLVSVRDVSAADLMKRLAQVTGGEWEEKDGVYRLALSGPVSAKEAREERIARGEAWLAMVRQQQQQRTEGRYSDGQNGIAEAMIAKLPAEMLGGLGFKQRVVFSTRPTRMQRPLTNAMLAGIDLSKLGTQSIMRLGNEAVPSVAPIACVQLTIQADEQGRTLYHSLAIADASGRVFRGEAGQIWGYNLGWEPKEGSLKLPHPDLPVKLAKEEAARARLIAAVDPIDTGMNLGEGEGNAFGGRVLYSTDDLNKPSPIRGVREALQPEAREPLSLVAGPLLARFAEGQGENIVADLPDAAFHGASALARDGVPKAENIPGVVRQRMGMAIQHEAGWLLGRPLRPAFARENRLDRAALGKALRTLDRTGTLTLEEQADFAQAAPLVCGEAMLDAPMFALVRPDLGRQMLSSPSSGERQLLRLYKALGTSRVNGDRAFGTLPAAVRQGLSDLVFNGLSGPDHQIQAILDGHPTTWMPPSNPHVVPGVLDQERTVYWGNGIPANARFNVEDRTEPATFGLAPNGARPLLSEGGGGYGMRGNANGTTIVYTPLPRLDRYAMGSLRRIAFILADGTTTTFRRALESTSVPTDASAIPYASLPAAMRKRIEDNEEMIQKALSDPNRGLRGFGDEGKSRP